MTIPTRHLIALTELPAALAAHTGNMGEGPSYRRLYNLILDGVIPADRINGKLYVNVDLLPQIAARVGMLSARKTSIAA